MSLSEVAEQASEANSQIAELQSEVDKAKNQARKERQDDKRLDEKLESIRIWPSLSLIAQTLVRSNMTEFDDAMGVGLCVQVYGRGNSKSRTRQARHVLWLLSNHRPSSSRKVELKGIWVTACSHAVPRLAAAGCFE